MTDIFNFDIKPLGTVSKTFLAHNVSSFYQASIFVRTLKYGRNKDKLNLTSLFIDNCGTCSTKHALLKKLADENHFSDIKLILGIFRMNSSNTPKISETLKRNNLDYIPEAHNYLKWKNQKLDFTNKASKSSDFEDELIVEIEIQPEQISDFKVSYHKQYLAKWLERNENINLTLADLWKIREQCIADLCPT